MVFMTVHESASALVDSLKPLAQSITPRQHLQTWDGKRFMDIGMADPRSIMQGTQYSRYATTGILLGRERAAHASNSKLMRGLSREHCLLTIPPGRGGALAVADLGSRNGTFINGDRLAPHDVTLLHDGDVLTLASAAKNDFDEAPLAFRVAPGESSASMARRAAEAARRGGSTDDITAIVCQLSDDIDTDKCVALPTTFQSARPESHLYDEGLSTSQNPEDMW